MRLFFLFQIKIYQILDPEDFYSVNGLKLLDVKRTSAHVHGWFVFQVQTAIEEWVNGTSTNYGKCVKSYNVCWYGTDCSENYLRFSCDLVNFQEDIFAYMYIS